MKIQFLRDTFIRNALDLPEADPIGIIYKGVVIEVEEQLQAGAFSLKNNNRWYRDRNGWYYWSGDAKALAAENPVPAGTIFFDLNNLPDGIVIPEGETRYIPNP